jgi:hypothetical protein
VALNYHPIGKEPRIATRVVFSPNPDGVPCSRGQHEEAVGTIRLQGRSSQSTALKVVGAAMMKRTMMTDMIRHHAKGTTRGSALVGQANTADRDVYE